MLHSVENIRKLMDENQMRSKAALALGRQFVDDLEVYLQAVEEEIEQNYIELPKDEDGMPVKVGDMLEGERIGGGWCEPFEVNTMTYGTGGWLVRDSSGYSRDPRHTCHYHEPTVEDVLREMLHTAYGIEDEKLIAEYAERLQLKEDE